MLRYLLIIAALIVAICACGAWFEASARTGLGLDLGLGSGGSTVGAPVTPTASTFLFKDTGGIVFKDTGGIVFQDY